MCDEACGVAGDGFDALKKLIVRLLSLASCGQNLNDVAPRDLFAMEPHALGPVVLEDEAELPLRGKGADVSGELSITELYGPVYKVLNSLLRGLSHLVRPLALLVDPLPDDFGNGFVLICGIGLQGPFVFEGHRERELR